MNKFSADLVLKRIVSRHYEGVLTIPLHRSKLAVIPLGVLKFSNFKFKILKMFVLISHCTELYLIVLVVKR
jgi:hypothetical protein